MTQLPTGGGKTEIAGALLKKFLVGDRKAVWLTHQEELANQTEDRLSENWSINARHATERWPHDQPAPGWPNRVAIFKAQTVSRRNKESETVWDNYGRDDLLIIDEAHHAPASGWERAIEQWPGQVWGLTATPWRLKSDEGFHRLFDTLVTGPQTSALQADGYLAHSRVFTPYKKENRISGKEIRQGEYTPSGIERANDRVIMTTLAVEFWQNVAAGRQTIAYAVSQRHASNLVKAFRDKGITADLILSTSETSQSERERVKRDFEAGRITVLVNVAVVTEGFDLPDASCVMMTRPTKSLALYLQMVGRGLRPKDDGGDCLILDLAGNADEHGLPDKEREWSLAARGNPVAGEPPVSHCPECYFTTHPAHHKCPECAADLGKYCLQCGTFRPWSRWTINCPINEHEAACDRCDPNYHGGGRYDPKRSSLSYAQRAYERGSQGDLEGALTDWSFAIHAAKREPEYSTFTSPWVVSLYIDRACIHFKMGNIKLAEYDFSAVENLFDLNGTYHMDDAFLRYRKRWNQIPALYSRDLRELAEMHQKRAEMYEELGCPEKAEFDRQKAKELNDGPNPMSKPANGENAR